MTRLGDRVHFLHLRNVKRETGVAPGSFYEAVWRRNLGRILYDRGDTDGALAEAERALAIVLALYPASHSEVARTRSVYAELLIAAGRPADARTELTAALQALRESYPHREDHFEIRDVRERLAALEARE